ncbi:hypothetical protein CHELA40_10362 [Chelatococcus asaccharovorans]|nr:hypothetical protein CHELA40_10362 [Chelatococcus asaccharovorans]CAH1686769.1 hypothetical protein CHELA17_65246 [Chelatococcus asaccharovorans]
MHQVLIIKRLSLFGAIGTMANRSTSTIAPQLNSGKKTYRVFRSYRMVKNGFIIKSYI